MGKDKTKSKKCVSDESIRTDKDQEKDIHYSKKMKKKHKKDCTTDEMITSDYDVEAKIKMQDSDLEKTEESNRSSDNKKKKKKKKRIEDKDSEQLLETTKINEEKVKLESENESPEKKHKKKKKHKDLTADECSSIDMLESEEICSKPKKKKKNRDIQEGPTNNSTLESDDVSSSRKKKKKKNRDKPDEVHIDNGASESEEFSSKSEEVSNSTKKKKKKRSKDTAECNDFSELEPLSKKKKKEKHQDLLEDDLKDNESYQRKKSDMEELSASSRENKSNGNLDGATSGQWGTAFGEDKQKQSKFLRLLGGFKKGGCDEEKEQKFNKKFANYAMDQNREKVYQKNLEQQYEKAMTSNLQRGIGLGFQAPPDAGKKFYIDAGASKSKKFDD